MLTIIVGKHLPVQPVEALLDRNDACRYVCVDTLEAALHVRNRHDAVLIVDHALANGMEAGARTIITDARHILTAEFERLFLACENEHAELAEAA